MQKVEGSSPFIRSSESPAIGAFLLAERVTERANCKRKCKRNAANDDRAAPRARGADPRTRRHGAQWIKPGRNAGSSGTLQGLSATNAPATSATESGTVSAELLTAAVDCRFHCFQGDTKFAEDVGGKRVGNAKHAEQDVLVGERPFAGVIERVRERLLQPRRDTQAAGLC